MRARSGDLFLVCVDAEADFSGLQKDIADAQRSAGVGGDKVRINKRDFLCIKGRVDLANSNEMLRLGMSRGNFEKEYINNGLGFSIGFECTTKTLTFSWQNVVLRCDEVMFFGRKFGGGGLMTSNFERRQISSTSTTSSGSLPLN